MQLMQPSRMGYPANGFIFLEPARAWRTTLLLLKMPFSAISFQLSPSHAISNLEREMLALTARLGSLGLPNPIIEAPAASKMATNITQPLVEHLLGMSSASIIEVFTQQLQARVEARCEKEVRSRTIDATV